MAALGDSGAFCSSWTQYRWCADFDELDADVTWGFALGQPAQWTSVSPNMPTLSTHYTSPPRSLTFTGAPSGGQEYGSWVLITLAITSQSVSLAADTANVSFNRSVSSTSVRVQL